MAASRLVWDQATKRLYETGTRRGVLFVMDQSTGNYKPGVAWNGLTKVTQQPEGGEETALYADNQKYLSLYSQEIFKATIEAYTYPDEFGPCDGSAEIVPGAYVGQQDRVPFGFSYETIVGNDSKGNEYGRKIHIIYNAKAAPSERSYETVNSDPAAITFSWAVTTTPVEIADMKPTSYFEIDSTKVGDAIFKKVEDALYGSSTAESTLPTPAQLIALLKGTTSGTPSGS